MQRGIEGKQAVKGKCDCRENKLEKTKGDSILHILLVSSNLSFSQTAKILLKKKKFE